MSKVISLAKLTLITKLGDSTVLSNKKLGDSSVLSNEMLGDGTIKKGVGAYLRLLLPTLGSAKTNGSFNRKPLEGP